MSQRVRLPHRYNLVYFVLSLQRDHLELAVAAHRLAQNTFFSEKTRQTIGCNFRNLTLKSMHSSRRQSQRFLGVGYGARALHDHCRLTLCKYTESPII